MKSRGKRTKTASRPQRTRWISAVTVHKVLFALTLSLVIFAHIKEMLHNVKAFNHQVVLLK